MEKPPDRPRKRPRVEVDAQDKAKQEEGGTAKAGSQYIHANVSITCRAAEIAMCAAEEVASLHGWKVSIAIADAGGNPIIVKRLCDAIPGSIETAV